jgi:Lrp/AsnC family transcriptional regulator, leucine-responsive regulatory protein
MSKSDGAAGGSTGQSETTLDQVDLKILSQFREAGRISMSALADSVGVSRATAYTRVEALVHSGVITGFSARVDPRRTGLGICALVFVTVRPQTWTSFRRRVLEMTQIEYCAVTTGQHDAMLLIRARDVAEVHEFVTNRLSVLPEIRAVETVLVLDEVVDRPYLLPQDIPTDAAAVPQIGMTRFIRAPETHVGIDTDG